AGSRRRAWRSDTRRLIGRSPNEIHHGGTEGTEKKNENWQMDHYPLSFLRALRASVVQFRFPGELRSEGVAMIDTGSSPGVFLGPPADMPIPARLNVVITATVVAWATGLRWLGSPDDACYALLWAGGACPVASP